MARALLHQCNCRFIAMSVAGKYNFFDRSPRRKLFCHASPHGFNRIGITDHRKLPANFEGCHQISRTTLKRLLYANGFKRHIAALAGFRIAPFAGYHLTDQAVPVFAGSSHTPCLRAKFCMREFQALICGHKS